LIGDWRLKNLESRWMEKVGDKTMNKEKITKDEKAELRKQAEAELGGRPEEGEDLSFMSPEAKDRMLHELRVHQIELEMQNDELRRVQSALEAARDKYSDLYDFSPVGYFSIGKKGMISGANLTGSAMLGVERGSLIGKPFSHFVHEDDQDLYYHHGKALFKTKSPRSCELRLKRRDGSEFWAQLQCIVVLDGEGGLNLIQAAVSNIHERKRAEEALRESEAFLKTLIDAIPTPVFYKDRDGKYLGFNRAFETFFGETKERLIGKSVFDINPPELAEIYHTQDDELFNSGGVQRYESQWKDAHGKLRDFIFNKAVFTDSKGAVTGLIGVLIDITERKQAEAALQESEKKYRSMMEAMKDPVYICSPDFRVEYMNPAMIRRTGRDATGEHCFKALHDLEEKCPWCMHDKAQQGEHLELEIVSPKDNHFYHVSQSPILHEDGSISKMTVFRDTTDLRTLETQLQQAQKMEAIGTLAGGIAHDFNNILGGIMGFAELAKMKAPEDSDVFADLEQVMKSSKRAADLVSQILTISRHRKKEQRPVQVRYIVHEATSLLRATLPTTIEIREDLSQVAGIINADPTQMHQVIMNLGTNAGHAMQEDGGVLEVSLANVEIDDLEAAKHLDLVAGPYLRLTVSDTGHGITSEVMEKIFDPYFTTKDTGEGTGLGLSVAQGIVKTHGGTITAYSEPGKGTTFHVYLPIILEVEREEENASEGPLPTGSERILLIDDEAVLIDIGSQTLERLGYAVVTRQSSVEALALFRAEPDNFNLVITDMTMPHMTGDQLARELMKIRPDIPVILCTGNSRLISEEKIKEIGIKAVVIKPVLKRTMAETVREVLDEE
jgi:PAS domain S-box-containing protein